MTKEQAASLYIFLPITIDMSEVQHVGDHPKKPSNIDELRRLKQAKKEAKKKLNSKPQMKQSPPGKVYERPFATVPDQPALIKKSGEICVMTFNILAQSLIKRKLFPDSGDYIKWKARRKMILDEIKLYKPDILTMQELDNFEVYYEAMFNEMGYKVMYYTHPTKRHGCGIAYKESKFNSVKYATVDYNTDTTCPPSYMTGNIAQLLALQWKSDPSIGFVVGNTHLYWRPTSNYERFRQTIIYSNRLLDFKQKLDENTRWEPLLFGDFNTTPDDAAYGLLTTNHLSDFHVQDLNESRIYKATANGKEHLAEEEEEEEEEQDQITTISADQLDTIEMLLAKYHNQGHWKSIYSHFGRVNPDSTNQGLFGEPRFTDYASQFQGTLDYMFIDANSPIKINSLLLMPDEEQYLKPSLPNSQNQKSFSIDVGKDDTVALFRSTIMATLKIPKDTAFSLIALGKIMLDHCQDGTLARLNSTYRVRDKSTVFVHLYTAAKKRKRPCPRIVITAGRKRQKTPTIDNMNAVTLPFDDFVCPTCANDARRKTCPDCGCVKCLLKTGDPLICDQCNNYWHIECAGLSAEPKCHYWYCPDCYNRDHEKIVGKDEQLQSSGSKGITIKEQECAVVHQYHVGKIPGVRVGQTWATRSLMTEWGVHRSPVMRVAGNGRVGAVSIVLTYGVIEDPDDGDEFICSGVGGFPKHRSVFSNAELESQELTRSNLLLALTCNTPVNAVNGGRALDWRKSQPIRVCRSSTLKALHPEFAPAEGFRYDGEYKIVRYWPYKEPTTGNLIWKYLFKRDDTEMPPWSSEGRRMISRRGLRMINPVDEETEELRRFTPSYKAQVAIAKDTQNRRLWNQISELKFWSEFEFLQYVFDEAFACSSHACPKPIKNPITTPCGHICCMRCLTKSKSNQCFTCRNNIPLESIQTNERLIRILKRINPAYNTAEDTYELPSTIAEEQLQEDALQEVRVVIEPLNSDTSMSPETHEQSEIRPLEAVVIIETYME
ncbi:uncharacterized protein ATC70_008966 [Mucor velutinosus]|uniref:RING-type E3 ubiquitin transferase n=1 Tax=Mucor velutinosus TaxID=708070 RepID=A0AAN7DLF4_9FUNG|nr:hypothetical protein ATC70_008966 [Mucor velutinosus]